MEDLTHIEFYVFMYMIIIFFSYLIEFQTMMIVIF